MTGVAKYDATSASHFTNNHPCLLTRDYSQYRVISTARQTITGKSSACALLVFLLFAFSLRRRSLFLARCKWRWLGYGCFNHVRLPVCGSLPVTQTCYILEKVESAFRGKSCTRCKNVASLPKFYCLLDRFRAMLDPSTSSQESGTA